MRTPLRFDGLDAVPDSWPRSVVCIGVFDGVHAGHREILARARQTADQLTAGSGAGPVPLVAITFDPHPSEVVRPGTHPPMLATVSHRVRLLGQAGADAVVVLRFTRELANLTPAEFATEVLAGRLHAAAVVVGENFRFGHRAAGTVATLAEWGERLGFTVTGLSLVGGAVAGDAVAWSSTYVRQCVVEGDVVEAAAVLGRPHRVEGVVVHGDHRGRDLGYPTANLLPGPHAAIPADGVYAGWLLPAVDDDATAWPAAVSIGTNPTFDGAQRRVEAYVLDRDDLDLYGCSVAVEFGERLRPTLRFETVEQLIDQMARDVEQTRQVARQRR